MFIQATGTGGKNSITASGQLSPLDAANGRRGASRPCQARDGTRSLPSQLQGDGCRLSPGRARSSSRGGGGGGGPVRGDQQQQTRGGGRRPVRGCRPVTQRAAGAGGRSGLTAARCGGAWRAAAFPSPLRHDTSRRCRFEAGRCTSGAVSRDLSPQTGPSPLYAGRAAPPPLPLLTPALANEKCRGPDGR